MTSEHDKAKRWRPRFSVRTLVILVTLVCCYAACWGPTKSDGELDVFWHAAGWARPRFDVTATAIVPLCVGTSEPIYKKTPSGIWMVDPNKRTRRTYFWFFGYVAKLPYEREI